ncbi:MAG TPA: hypothetical protein VNT32_07450 [Thermoleophilaceae bacterium]|nr:hypothetical protein [Thermoleophilaceae bacterium]
MTQHALPVPATRLRAIAETPELERRLALALELVRLGTGLVWEPATERDEALAVVHGAPGWARARAAEAGGPCLVVPAGGAVTPAAATAAMAVDEVAPELHVLGGDAPAVMAELVRPVSGQMTSMQSQCHPLLPLAEPWVDRLTEALAARLAALAPAGSALYRLRPVPGGADWGVALSHDMDYVETTARYRATRLYYLMYGLRGRSGRVVRHHLRALASPRPWLHAEAALAEEEAGARSEWFVFARHPGQRGAHAALFNPEYDLSDPGIRALLRGLRDRGHVVSLHASPEAGADPVLMRAERDLLAAAVGTDVTGVRHHMGRCVWPVAPDGWRRAGFAYDSSFIINDGQGYRLGTAGPVPVDGMLELSPSWMDTVAYNYESKEPEVLLAELHALVDRVRGRGGVEGVVWHDIPMGRGYPGVAVYREFLRYARDRGGHIGPCAEFVRHSRALADARVEDGRLVAAHHLGVPERVGPPREDASVGTG